MEVATDETWSEVPWQLRRRWKNGLGFEVHAAREIVFGRATKRKKCGKLNYARKNYIPTVQTIDFLINKKKS